MMTLLPLSVDSCFALPLISRRFGAPSFVPGAPVGGTRRTWLARKSSEAMTSLTAAPLSVSRDVSSTSVRGTSRMWWWTGVHCEAIELLKKAARKGFSGCIHSTLLARCSGIRKKKGSPATGYGRSGCTSAAVGVMNGRRWAVGKSGGIAFGRCEVERMGNRSREIVVGQTGSDGCIDGILCWIDAL